MCVNSVCGVASLAGVVETTLQKDCAHHKKKKNKKRGEEKKRI